MPAPPSVMKPSPLLHCEKVYMTMRNTAKEKFEGEVPMIVWEGFLTQLMRDLELSVPYYSTIRSALIDMGCMRQLRRGGGTSPSQWELLKEPTLELWGKMQESDPNAKTRGVNASINAASKTDVKHVRQMCLDLQDRVDTLESHIQSLVQLFNDNIKQRKGA
jgi:hypothetical protein